MLFAALRRKAGVFVVLDPFLFVAVVVFALACDKEIIEVFVCRRIASGELAFRFDKV